jgi:hypothetical protein
MLITDASKRCLDDVMISLHIGLSLKYFFSINFSNRKSETYLIGDSHDLLIDVEVISSQFQPPATQYEHFPIILKWMDGWMDGWMGSYRNSALHEMFSGKLNYGLAAEDTTVEFLDIIIKMIHAFLF